MSKQKVWAYAVGKFDWESPEWVVRLSNDPNKGGEACYLIPAADYERDMEELERLREFELLVGADRIHDEEVELHDPEEGDR